MLYEEGKIDYFIKTWSPSFLLLSLKNMLYSKNMHVI